MLYLLHNLKDKLRERKNQSLCKRCGLVYNKTLDNCPHCYHINDHTLKLQLKKRANERINLGKGMVLGAILLIFIMIIITF